MPNLKITKTEVDKLVPTGTRSLFWDQALKGFGLALSPTGVRTYIVQYRTAGGRSGQTRRMTIGRHGSPWTPDTARAEAKRILFQAATGSDPVAAKQKFRQMPTVAELCDQYLAEGTGTKKPSTLATDRGRIERHIKPLLGKRKVADVTAADVKRFLKQVAEGATAADVKTKLHGRARVTGGKGAATRTVGLLGGIFTYAMELGLTKTNPVQGVKRFADKRNERFLSLDELARLGAALLEAERRGVNSKAIDIIKLLALTGARRGEIEKLRWSEIDLEGRRLILADSKTGQKSLPLNGASIGILASRSSNDLDRRGYVFTAATGTGYFSGLPRAWRLVRASAGLNDVRLHDLRHSFASVGVMGGAPLMVIGALLGHGDHATTQRYAHLANDPIAAASEQIGTAISGALDAGLKKSAASSA